PVAATVRPAAATTTVVARAPAPTPVPSVRCRQLSLLPNQSQPSFEADVAYSEDYHHMIVFAGSVAFGQERGNRGGARRLNVEVVLAGEPVDRCTILPRVPI
ncbi:hypothetical protein, partial [Streptomyces sp900116325]|uniref:hypothetical protein n=1 Tax=Streptomyces sp. 900116325 TaxID=3154295 RepID=UPI00340174E8